VLCLGPSTPAQGGTQLVFPGLLAKDQREAGNPLATYAAMLELEEAYRAHDVFRRIYPEVRCNFEEFLGDPLAGQRAMTLLAAPGRQARDEVPLPPGHVARAAMDEIARAAATTRLVVFGEEHHLPQTRSLYEPMLRALRDRGYRYLAAETFTASVMEPGFTVPSYRTGYYTMDPVFAGAVRTAKQLGYTLIAYDTTESGPAGDASFRDRTQAENLKRLVFDTDPEARLVVLAGRAHAAEAAAADGWTPMASVLKRLTGIDPFTVYAPAMSQRQTPEEEHPMYRFATREGLVTAPTIFVGEGGKRLGSDSFDAYVFWPRFEVIEGRPDWMVRTLGRTRTAIPPALRTRAGLHLVQAFVQGDTPTTVPVDQVLLRPGEPPPALMLPKGSFWLRSVDAKGTASAPVTLTVE
jgi:hypothetical protein